MARALLRVTFSPGVRGNRETVALGAAGVVTFVAVLLLPFTGEGCDEVPDRKGDMRAPGSDESSP
jgi:hypothetical protein